MKTSWLRPEATAGEVLERLVYARGRTQPCVLGKGDNKPPWWSLSGNSCLPDAAVWQAQSLSLFIPYTCMGGGGETPKLITGWTTQLGSHQVPTAPKLFVQKALELSCWTQDNWIWAKDASRKCILCTVSLSWFSNNYIYVALALSVLRHDDCHKLQAVLGCIARTR